MRIKVADSDYIITSDSRQYMLAVDTGRIDKDGRPILDYLGFYNKINYLLDDLLTREPKMSQADTFEKFKDYYCKVEKDVKRIGNCLAQLIDKESDFKRKLEGFEVL